MPRFPTSAGGAILESSLAEKRLSEERRARKAANRQALLQTIVGATSNLLGTGLDAYNAYADRRARTQDAGAQRALQERLAQSRDATQMRIAGLESDRFSQQRALQERLAQQEQARVLAQQGLEERKLAHDIAMDQVSSEREGRLADSESMYRRALAEKAMRVAASPATEAQQEVAQQIAALDSARLHKEPMDSAARQAAAQQIAQGQTPQVFQLRDLLSKIQGGYSQDVEARVGLPRESISEIGLQRDKNSALPILLEALRGAGSRGEGANAARLLLQGAGVTVPVGTAERVERIQGQLGPWENPSDAYSLLGDKARRGFLFPGGNPNLGGVSNENLGQLALIGKLMRYFEESQKGGDPEPLTLDEIEKLQMLMDKDRSARALDFIGRKAPTAK